VRRTRVILLSAMLASCTTSRLDTPLAGLDLNDRATLARLQRDLAPEDRGALALYALLHWPGSAAFCGEPLLDSQGRLPQTIGEALRLTKARQAADAAAAVQRARPLSQGEKRLAEQEYEINRRDALLARQQVAMMQADSPESRAELRDIEAELEAVNARLEELTRPLPKDR
jgi:ABC-type multidrug transport system ATPase subunit